MATYLYRKGASLTSTACAAGKYRRREVEGRTTCTVCAFFDDDVSAIDLAYSALFYQHNLELLGKTRILPSELQIPIPYDVISEASVEIESEFISRPGLTRTERLHRRSSLLELATSPMTRDVVLHGTYMYRPVTPLIPHIPRQETLQAFCIRYLHTNAF